MLKILYAASNKDSAKIQLARFMKSMVGKPYLIKVAAYKKSSPIGIPIDWTLDCLLNIYKPDHISLENDNFKLYFEQIKYFNPDLIISDLEYFTSYIANVLNTTLWQCSSSLINFALAEKYDIGLFKRYAFALNRNSKYSQRTINIIDNSNCNFVYSHLCDVDNPPILKENFEWIRPYHVLGKESIPCQHNIVAGLLRNNKKIISTLKKYSDCVVFTDFSQEKYDNISLKRIDNEDEYSCNLRNSNLFMCEGESSFLADAFYNGKYSIISTNFDDPECIINSVMSERYHLGSTECGDIEKLNMSINYQYSSKASQLHDKIKEYG